MHVNVLKFSFDSLEQIPEPARASAQQVAWEKDGQTPIRWEIEVVPLSEFDQHTRHQQVIIDALADRIQRSKEV